MRKYSARFGIGGGEGDLIADHTESRNSNVAQKVHILLEEMRKKS